MISDRHRAIFIHIQKSGGNSVRAALGGALKDPRKHWTARELRATMSADTWARYFKFAVVRNPWARMVSWWRMAERARAKFDRGEKVAVLARTALARARTFDQFLQRMDDDLTNPDGYRWNMWRNQIDYLEDQDGVLLVDFVARTETLAADFERIRERLAAPADGLPHANAARVRVDYRDYYNPSQADLIGNRFARDIAYFGYRFGES